MKKLGLFITAIALTSAPAFASGINYVCPSLSASVCSALDTTTEAQYASLFSNANAVILVQSGSTGDVAETTQWLTTVSYTAYYNALVSKESGANDVTAVNSLGGGTTNPVVSGANVDLTSALYAALGLTISPIGAPFGTNVSGGSCSNISAANACYNAIITVSNTANFFYDNTSQVYSSGEYDFFTTVEHETDEVLGTISCLSTSNTSPNPPQACSNGVSAADLFRYSTPGTRSFLGPGGDQAEGTPAYFSINSGNTNIASYNNTNNFADYGDFSSACSHVQDAFGCSNGFGMTIANDGGPEIAMLDAVGYKLTPTGQSLSGADAPEPGTTGMFVLGLGMAGAYVRRQRCQRG